MANVNMSSFSYALQEYYDKQKIMEVAAREHPFLSILMKRPIKSSGEVHVLATAYSTGDGRSSTFSDAQGNPAGSKGVKFKIETATDYAIVRIDNEVLLSSEGSDAAAFMSARTNEFNLKLQELGNSISHSLIRDGSGVIGQIVGTQNASSTTHTLKNPDDIIFFEVGQRIQGADAATGGNLVATVNYIKSIDRANGTFKVSATDGGAALTATQSGLTANIYIVRKGDYDSKMIGLQGWLPTSVTPGESFFGVDRSVDKERLAGWYLDYSTSSREDAIIDTVKTICRFSQARPDIVLMSFYDWAELAKSLSSQVRYIDVKPNGDAAYGFQAILINGPKGPLQVIPEADVVTGEMFVLQSDTWSLIHKGKDVMGLLTYDGNQVLRVADADAIEGRFGSYSQLGCRAPGFNARVKIS